MNIKEFDEKIRMKQEVVAKMQEDIDRRLARLEKVNAEIKQLEDDQAKAVGYYWLGMINETSSVTGIKHDDLTERFKQFLLEQEKKANEEISKSETVTVSENSKSDYAPYSETETSEDEQEELEETVEEEQTVTEDFETDDTSGYANSFYQQGRNYYRNNNS